MFFFIFPLQTFIGPYYSNILDFSQRYNIPTATRRLLSLVQLPPALGYGGLDWDPCRAPGLVRPVRGHVDPAVIEDVRLVFAELIRLGGPKRQKLIFERKTRDHRTAPGKKWCPQLHFMYRRIYISYEKTA